MEGKKKLSGFLCRLALVSVAAFLLFACDNGRESDETGGRSAQVGIEATELRLPGGDWGFPSPFGFYPRGPGYVYMSLIYDTLTWKDRKCHIPWLAETWEMFEGTSIWSFTLRPDLQWHDGKPLTARDVAFTFNYLKTHPVEWFPVEIIDRVVAMDDRRAVFHLTKPFVAFIDLIAGSVPIIPEHVWGDIADPRQMTETDKLVGSGPYRLIRYDKTQGAYAYEANDGFFLRPPKVRRLLFVPAGDRVAALDRGDVDVSDVPASLAARFREHPDLEVISGPAFWVLKLQFNRNRHPFSMIAFRQAVASAVNRSTLIAQCVPGGADGAKPGSPGLIPPDSQWYENGVENLYPYDIEKARSLLESSDIWDRDGDGICEDADGKTMQFSLICPAQSLREAQVLKQMLANIGLALEIKTLDQKGLDAMIRSGRFDLVLFGHGGLGGDPSIAFSFGMAGNIGLPGDPSDPEYIAAAGKLSYTADAVERRALCSRMQQLYAAELPCLPLYYPVWHHAFKAAVFSSWFYTGEGGISTGIPSVYNKLVFIGEGKS